MRPCAATMEAMEAGARARLRVCVYIYWTQIAGPNSLSFSSKSPKFDHKLLALPPPNAHPRHIHVAKLRLLSTSINLLLDI